MFETLPGYIPGQRTMAYAGIGARKTPQEVLAVMEKMARGLDWCGYTLRSGGAQGADSAFESGANTKEVFYASDANEVTRRIARELHPNPGALSEYALNLMARNTYQVFGRNLISPADFVLCWTPDGCESHIHRTRRTGGTGQAISMASLKGIPVINMANNNWFEKLSQIL